ncbi:MAG: nucleoside 2-deoxyribosyltransferase domain-containing protein [Streptosporangiales bacterium]|nr:nucleoside 2-deoxyribosyltransferase domain-containing protein [Streptosporangiales bacterium]
MLAGTRVFLAGSIEMGTAEDWQTRVVAELSGAEGVVILNPRREKRQESVEPRAAEPRFAEQVNWELDMLDAAGIGAV